MKCLDVEDEIDILETVIDDLESAIRNVSDSPYHSYLANTWELDLAELKSRLDTLYEKQNEIWEKELQEQNLQYLKEVWL